MSFAATTALVAAYNWIRDARIPMGPRWTLPVTSVLISSSVAGLATAPIAAAHFNQFAHYGLVANLLSVPLMGVLVMPAGVIAALLLPFGLESLALWVMGKGIDWILWVAHRVAEFPGARGTVISPGPEVLPLIAFGGLIIVLWRGWGRVAGTIPLLLGFLLWGQTDRPDVLIADTGALIGVMTPEGRALNLEKGGGFIAQNWLENDGDAADQHIAATRWSDPSLPGLKITALRGKRAAEGLAAGLLDCDKAELIVLNADPPEGVINDLPCEVLHPRLLRETGAMALHVTKDGIQRVTARQMTGARLWNMP
jgi:competence protein ComEC